MKSWLQRFTGLLLSLLLSGAPGAWEQSSQPQAPKQAQPAHNNSSTDPSAELPDSPGYLQTQARTTTVAQADQPQPPQETQPAQAQPAETQPAQSQQSQPEQAPPSAATPPDQNPAGAAAAQRGKTAGGAASRPAGAALAPAKQRNPRSLLVKLGLLAGAGAALGTVFALSQASPSRPPGAH